METFVIVLFIITTILFLIGFVIKTIELKYLKNENEETGEEKDIDTSNGKAEESEEYPYIRPYLLTKNEWSFYKSLKPITDKYNLHILAKVRLGDLVDVKKGLSKSERSRAYARVRSKHVDFVLANPKNLAVLCVIELDDSSHQRIDRQQRDYFVDEVCKTVKLPIIHCTGINRVEDEICDKLKIHKK